MRATLIDELQEILSRTDVATVFVTHDRGEAMRLGSSVAVMMDGRVRQVGTPAEIFAAPVDEDVAAFVGVECVWPGVVQGVQDGIASVHVAGHTVEAAAADAANDARVLVCLRPEEVVLSARDAAAPSSARNRIPGDGSSRSHRPGLRCGSRSTPASRSSRW